MTKVHMGSRMKTLCECMETDGVMAIEDMRKHLPSSDDGHVRKMVSRLLDLKLIACVGGQGIRANPRRYKVDPQWRLTLEKQRIAQRKELSK